MARSKNPVISVDYVETFYYLPKWVRKTTESTEDTEKQQLSVPSVSSVVNLSHNQSPPGKIKKSPNYTFVQAGTGGYI